MESSNCCSLPIELILDPLFRNNTYRMSKIVTTIFGAPAMDAERDRQNQLQGQTYLGNSTQKISC